MNSIVKIVNNYNVFSGNGVVYKTDDNYMYVVTSSKIVTDSNNYNVIYSNGIYKNSIVLGIDEYNEIAVFRTEKVDGILQTCLANSNFVDKGEVNYLVGYGDKDIEFAISANVSMVGYMYSNNNYKKIYKNVLKTKGNERLKGTGAFDSLGRLSGIVTGYNKKAINEVYICDVNRIVKIADSIVKTGNYEINYIIYSIVDLSSLSSELRSSYEVSEKNEFGVVIETFKPINYLFGGLNQGMVIISVNGIKINNCFELDNQLIRYKKGSKVCLEVVKKNGKHVYYYVTI